MISADSQYSLLRRLVSILNYDLDEVEKTIFVCSYGVILGTISETNLINLLRYAGIEDIDDDVLFMISYYVSMGLIKIRDERRGLVSSLSKVEEVPEDSEFVETVKKNIEIIRRDIS